MNGKLNRLTKQEILDDLDRYDTGLRNVQGEVLRLSTVVSFLIFKKALPQNDQLNPKMKPKEILALSKADLTFDSDWEKSDLNQPLKSEYMFLGLNFSYHEFYEVPPYGAFHVTKSKLIKDNVKGFVFLNILTNDSVFEESYITDVLKNVAVTNSQKVTQRFFINNKKKSLETTSLDKLLPEEETPAKKLELKRRLSDDKNTYEKSAKILQHECELIRPKQLIAFGADAENAVKKMAMDGLLTGEVAKLAQNTVRTYHYATALSVGRAIELKDELMKKIER